MYELNHLLQLDVLYCWSFCQAQGGGRGFAGALTIITIVHLRYHHWYQYRQMRNTESVHNFLRTCMYPSSYTDASSRNTIVRIYVIHRLQVSAYSPEHDPNGTQQDFFLSKVNYI